VSVAGCGSGNLVVAVAILTVAVAILTVAVDGWQYGSMAVWQYGCMVVWWV
jgi:hypothetical protein